MNHRTPNTVEAMSSKSEPTNIEDEPSHEIYANLIGKDPSKIILPQSCMKSTSIIIRTRNAESSIIPLYAPVHEKEEEECIDDDNFCTRTCTHRINHSFVNLYKSAINSLQTSPMSQLSLNKNNKGFQILTRMGFNEKDGGLGKTRQGKISPVKTVLKNDKRGLGSGKKRLEKVTHHCQGISSGASTTGEKGIVIKKEGKRDRKRKLKDELNDERIREKKVRMLINSDLPDEYATFLGI